MPESLDLPRRVVVVAVAAVAGLFMAVVTLAAVPPNPLSADARPATERLEPFFAQGWQLFAPSPLSADRILRFQGAYRTEGGERQTAWLDWSDVELDVVRERLVGGRAGYVANKMWALAQQSTSDAGEAGREVVVTPTTVQDAPSADATSARLRSSGVEPAEAERLAAYDRAVTSLATAALHSRHPDLDLVAVRYVLALAPVVPYEDRAATGAARTALTAELVSVPGGWRRPARLDAAASAAVREFERRHR